MALTEEDLLVIEEIFDRKFDTNLSPIKDELVSRKIFTTVINVQVDILDKIELMHGHIKLIMFHLNLSPESQEMKNTLSKVR